jgi:hypothetical protein
MPPIEIGKALRQPAGSHRFAQGCAVFKLQDLLEHLARRGRAAQRDLNHQGLP